MDVQSPTIAKRLSGQRAQVAHPVLAVPQERVPAVTENTRHIVSANHMALVVDPGCFRLGYSQIPKSPKACPDV